MSIFLCVLAVTFGQRASSCTKEREEKAQQIPVVYEAYVTLIIRGLQLFAESPNEGFTRRDRCSQLSVSQHFLRHTRPPAHIPTLNNTEQKGTSGPKPIRPGIRLYPSAQRPLWKQGNTLFSVCCNELKCLYNLQARGLTKPSEKKQSLNRKRTHRKVDYCPSRRAQPHASAP